MLSLQDLRVEARRGLAHDQGISEAIPMGSEPHSVVVFFQFAEHPDAQDLGEPTRLLSVSAITGKHVGEDDFRMAEWGLVAANDSARAGRRRSLPGQSTAELVALRAEFETALQAMMARYFLGVQQLEAQSEREMANLLLDRWEAATEEGFLQYYLAVGWEWFSWLERVRSRASW